MNQVWEEKFNECLGIEFTNPEYFKVHHLLVICYMIQTSRYTDDYIGEALQMLKTFLEGPFSIDRKTILALNTRFSSNKRANKLIKPVEDSNTIPWNKTILDIRVDSAENYQTDVISWAKDVLQILTSSIDSGSEPEIRE